MSLLVGCRIGKKKGMRTHPRVESVTVNLIVGWRTVRTIATLRPK